jgi:hypothetical protein
MLFEYRSRIKGDGDFVKVTRLVFRLIFLFTPPCIVFLLFISPAHLFAADAGVSGDIVSAPSVSTSPFGIQGYLSGKFVSRTARFSGEKIHDDDIFSDLRLDVSRPTDSPYEFHFFGTLRDDLSSDRNRTTFSPFEDIGDTYGSAVHGYLYEAHLDLNRPFAKVSQIRIGRQDGTRGEPIFFDGLAADIGLAPHLAATVFGGVAVHFYELDSHWGDDGLGGLGIDYFPLVGTLVNMDYLYVTDKREIFDTTTQRDQLISLRINQRFTPNLRATAKVRYLNGDSRDLKLTAAAALPDMDFEIILAYVSQFHTQNEQSNELSPYFDVLGPSYPYQSYDARVRKFFGKHLTIDLGYFHRSLVHAGQENAFNRPFNRTYAVFDLMDLFIDRVSVSLTGEHWKSGDRDFQSAGFDIGYAFKAGRRSPKINAGSYYSLYKYDYYILLGERTNVTTYYVKLLLPFAQRYSINGSYEYENGLEEYQTAKLGIRYDF